MDNILNNINNDTSFFEIRVYPDLILRGIANPVNNPDEKTLMLIEGMARSMYTNRGVGLAAPQVGFDQQVITFDIGGGLISLLNPRILEAAGEKRHEEGCLSLPDISLEIKRNSQVLVTGFDIKKDKEVTIEASDLLARVLQHEIDHLNGVLIIDKISSLKRQLLTRKFKRKKGRREET